MGEQQPLYPKHTRDNIDTIRQVVSFGFTFSICYGTSVGLGRHGEDVRAENEAALRKSEYAFSVLYASFCFPISRYAIADHYRTLH